LCGQKIANEKTSKQQTIDGTLYLFDTDSCLATFNKFQEVYGKDFTKGLAVAN
jgi:YHS domain-containing protein